MTKDKSRIQSCIDHINTAVDVDPWAKELVAEMGKEVLKYAKDINVPNNDCISRQAAIEVVRKYNESHMILKGKPILGAVSMMIELEDLPPVQPDIIACGDCKHYIPHDKRCGYWNHGVKPLEWCSQAERRTDDER